MLKHMLLFRVESKSEPILVEQVLEESLVVTGFDNSGVDPEPEIVKEGKPLVYALNHYLVYFEKFITYVTYCIKLIYFKCCLLDALPTLLFVYHP